MERRNLELLHKELSQWVQDQTMELVEHLLQGLLELLQLIIIKVLTNQKDQQEQVE